MSKITSIEQFLSKHFDHDSSDYIVTEAKFMNSFLKRLVDAGFSLITVHDGEDRHQITANDRFQALDAIFSVDESSIYIKSSQGEKFMLSLVLGNEDATTIADHSDLSQDLEKFIFTEFAKSVKTHSEQLYNENWSSYELG